MKRALIITILLVLSSTSYAGFKFEGVGARAIGMGGAFTAVCDDVNATYYNPAGLFRLKQMEGTFMRANKFGVIDVNYIALAQKNMGLSSVNQGAELEAGSIGIGAGPTKKTNIDETIYAISYAKRVHPKAVIGVNLTFLNLDSALGSDWGVGLDLGAITDFLEDLTLALMIRNIDAKVRDEKVPTSITMGCAYKINDEIIVDLDIGNKEKYKDSDSKITYRMGAEYVWNGMVALRIGAIKDGGLCVGTGFKQKIWQLDYAFGRLNKDLPNNHYISATFKF
ncbi:MAG: hypothetical protein QME40_03010 [bacterium]|nr:hypothetical protein [bacterium]